MGVRWGQAGSDFQLQNGLMQFVLLILSLMLTTTYAEALTKRSQSAKVAFKHQHPATGSPRGPCKGYVIDHIVPIAMGLMHRATCSGRRLPTPRRRTSGSARAAGMGEASTPAIRSMMGKLADRKSLDGRIFTWYLAQRMRLGQIGFF